MNKYGFKIKTRSGSLVENLQVQARDRAEAEQKIKQIYHHCEILECHEVTPTLRKEGLDLEDMIALINKQEEKKG
jgi:DNA-directed RNA polymerase specialized sigma54-like protein